MDSSYIRNMAKKGGKAAEMANVDSKKGRDEIARKQDEAYTMVQRAMFSSQVRTVQYNGSPIPGTK